MTIYEDHSLQTKIVNALPAVMAVIVFALALYVGFCRV